MGDYGACDVQKANAVSLQAEQVAVDARDFMYKPDGGARRLNARPNMYIWFCLTKCVHCRCWFQGGTEAAAGMKTERSVISGESLLLRFVPSHRIPSFTPLGRST